MMRIDVTIHLASVRGRGGDGSSPVAFANHEDLGTSRPRPCRVRLGDLNSYELIYAPTRA